MGRLRSLSREPDDSDDVFEVASKTTLTRRYSEDMPEEMVLIDGYKENVNLLFWYTNEVDYYIDSSSSIHGPMDQQQSTRLSAVTRTGGPLEGKLEAHVTHMNEHAEERRTKLTERTPTNTSASIMAASSDANELDRLLEELKVVGGDAPKSHTTNASHSVSTNRTVHVTPASQPQTSYSTTITRTHNAKVDKEQVLIDELRSAQDRLLSLRRAQSTEGAGGGHLRELEGVRYEQRGPGWENVSIVREQPGRNHHSSGEQEAFDISLRYSSLPASRKGHKEAATHWESTEQRDALIPVHTVRHRSSSSDRFVQPANIQTSHYSHESRSQTSGMRGQGARSVSVEAPRFPLDESDHHNHNHHQHTFHSSQEHFEPHRFDMETVEVHREEPLANSYSAHRENQRLHQQQQQIQQQREYQQSMQRTYQQSHTMQETSPEVVEEVETVTLQPIGKGVQDLEANSSGVPNAINNRTPTMGRAADAHSMAQQQQHTSSRSYQHSVQVHQSGRSPGPARHHFTSNSSTPFEHDGFGQHILFSQARTDSFSSMDGAFEGVGSGQAAPKFVKDTSCFWYKPKISREEAISLLRDKAPGLFVVRDSNSYPGAFGLAVKVAQLPPGVTPKSDDLQSELVRHFLIEPTSKGVRLKGCANEPVFGSLAALVYQHTLTPLALPCRLVVPEQDLGANLGGATDIARQGAACNLLYLGSVDVEALTGNNAVSRAVDIAIAQMNAGRPTTDVNFKASVEGITLTDSLRRLFFRRHYPLNLVSFCGLDPKDRVWDSPELRSRNIQESRIFAIVTRRQGSSSENVCHVFSELDPAQPATAVVRFVSKHLLGGH